ncbi:acyltransferase [Halobacterium yunchengense]|uniref:acyltransferase n=1 Tax=Halobacterium yunchengense TaxID=3108497 RepID=UPI00300A46B8
MLDDVAAKLASHPATSRLLFNRFTGTAGQYVRAARSRGRYQRYRRRYDVHPDFEFNGPGITLYGDGDVELGADAYVGRHSRIQAKDGCRVRVGENTAVSHFVFAYTQNRVADQDMSRAPNRNHSLDVREGDVDVGPHCWIGAFAFLAEGSSVGENAVVGANSVVTGDLPPHSVSAGAPARVREFKSYLDDAEAADLAAAHADVLSERVADAHLD